MEVILVPQSLNHIQAVKLFLVCFLASMAMQSTWEQPLTSSFSAAYNDSQQALQKGMNRAIRKKKIKKNWKESFYHLVVKKKKKCFPDLLTCKTFHTGSNVLGLYGRNLFVFLSLTFSHPEAVLQGAGGKPSGPRMQALGISGGSLDNGLYQGQESWNTDIGQKS